MRFGIHFIITIKQAEQKISHKLAGIIKLKIIAIDSVS